MTAFLMALLVSANPVRVGYEENHPMSFTGPGGEPSGLYVELFEQIAEEHRWEVVWVPGSWEELTSMLSAGEIDLLTCMAVTEERRDLYLFPENSVHSSWSILLQHAERPVSSIDDLNGAKIAMLSGDIHASTLVEILDELGIAFSVVECGTFAEAMEKVAAGEALCTPVPRTLMLSEDIPSGLVPQGMVWNPTVLSYAGNLESSATIIAAVDESLARMKADEGSVYYRLLGKWLSGVANRSIPPGFYALFVPVLVLLTVTIILINRRLVREAAKGARTLRNSRSLAEIALASAEVENLEDLYRTVGELLRKNLKAENFYLAIHDPGTGRFSFPFIKDEKNEEPDTGNSRCFTAWVHNSGKPVLLSRDEIIRMVEDPEIPVDARQEEIPFQYLAVPLQARGSRIGVIAFQNYREEQFTESDLLFVKGISNHLAGAFLRVKAYEDLARSRNRQKMLLDFDPTAIFLLDRKGRIIDCNRQAIEFTGILEEDLRGRNLSAFLMDSNHNVMDPLRKHRPGSPSHFSCNLLGEKGSVYAVDGIVNTFTEQGTLFHFVTIMDVTEKSLLEKDAMRNERLEAIGLLAGGIAHDFNNILTGVMGSLSLLRSAEGDQERKELLDSAEKAAERARSLTGQLLTFAKGGAPIRKSVETEAILRDVSGFVLRGSSVLLDVKVENGTWNLNVDAQQFSQVLQNIVTNARQAMNDKGRLFVRASNCDTPRGRLVLVEFEDTGPGIPSSIIENIFDPYFTTKAGGHGLGLATSFSIVQRHGGTIKAGHGVNGGALFSILVPASMEKTGEIEHHVLSRSVVHSGRILILDDDRSVLETAGNMLEKLGYTYDVAEEGQQAVDMYLESFRKGNPYKAAIMDLTIPGGFGGEEAVKLVLRTDPRAVVIVSSGYAGNDVMANYRQYGFKGVLTKPYTIEELSESLIRAMS